MRLTHGTISRVIQKKLHYSKIHVHNMLVRLIVRHVLDILGEQIPGITHLYLRRWNQQVVMGDYWIKRYPHLRSAYTPDAMKYRACVTASKFRKRVPAHYLSSAQRAELIYALDTARYNNNKELASAIAKALDTLPTK